MKNLTFNDEASGKNSNVMFTGNQKIITSKKKKKCTTKKSVIYWIPEI